MYKIVLISEKPLDLKELKTIQNWPFNYIDIIATDKTYIVIKGDEDNLKSITHLIMNLIPDYITGYSIVVEKVPNETIH